MAHITTKRLTVVESKAGEQRKDIFIGFLGRDLVEKRGKSLCDENPVEDGLAAGEEIYFLEGAEGIFGESKIKGKFNGGMGIVCGRRDGGRGKRGRGRRVKDLGRSEVWG